MALAPVRLTLAVAAAVVAVGAGFTNVAPVAARRARPLLPRRWPDDRWRLRVARANDLSSGRDEERAYDECDPVLTDTIGSGSDDDVVCSIENPYLETINEMDAEPSSVKKAIQGIGGYLTVLGGVLAAWKACVAHSVSRRVLSAASSPAFVCRRMSRSRERVWEEGVPLGTSTMSTAAFGVSVISVHASGLK